MYSRRLEPTTQSFFLLGPRGTGKSTWIRSLFRDALLDEVHFLMEERRYRKFALTGSSA